MTTDWDATGKLVTAVIAVYGAVVATYNLVASRRRALKVQAAVVPWVQRGKPTEPGLVVEAVNTGHRVVIIDSFGVRAGDVWLDLGGKAETDPESRPWSLEDGEDFKFFIPARELAGLLRAAGALGRVGLRAWIRDSTGKRFRSNRITFDTEAS